MSIDYRRCAFCGRAAPLLSGTEDGKPIVWFEYRNGEVITSDTICRRCFFNTATETESDRQTQRTITEIEHVGSLVDATTPAWQRHFGGQP